MASTSPDLISSPKSPASESDTCASDGVSARLVTRMSQIYCGLHGHDNLMQFQKDRVFLHCVSCGYLLSANTGDDHDL